MTRYDAATVAPTTPLLTAKDVGQERYEYYDGVQIATPSAILADRLNERLASRAAQPDLLALLRRIEPHIDAIVCYASTTDEHEPNKLAVDLRAALARRAAPQGAA